MLLQMGKNCNWIILHYIFLSASPSETKIIPLPGFITTRPGVSPCWPPPFDWWTGRLSVGPLWDWLDELPALVGERMTLKSGGCDETEEDPVCGVDGGAERGAACAGAEEVAACAGAKEVASCAMEDLLDEWALAYVATTWLKTIATKRI